MGNMIGLLEDLCEKKKATGDPPKYIKEVEKLLELYKTTKMDLCENKNDVV